MFDATFSVFNWVMRYLWQMEISLFGVVLKQNWGFSGRCGSAIPAGRCSR